jgi:acyl-CoA synthetase (AMP-forming)/AMP-acid ligase II
MNLVRHLETQVRERPQQAAIIAARGSLTFAELDTASRRAAAMLARDGLRAGEPVLIFEPMSVELYVALLAVFRLGAVAMFLDPSAGRAHLEACCALQTPRALIARDKAHLLRLRSKALRAIPLKYSIGWRVPGARRWLARESCAPLENDAACENETPALLTFTSGSTGQPKAAVRTHGFLVAQHAVLARSIALEAGEVDLATLPVFVLANLASGLTSVLPDANLRRVGDIEPGPVLRQVAHYQVTRCAASPAFFEKLLTGDRAALAGMRKLYTGGAPVFPRLLDALRSACPQAEVHAVYGSTEAEPIAHLEAGELSAADRAAMLGGKGLPAGVPVEEIELRILKTAWGRPIPPLTAEELAALTAPPREAGEIVVAGPHVLQGYLHGRGDEETKFQVAGKVWHRTGDAGYLDTEDRLWLLGRCAAMVTDARGTLWPFAVETVAMNHPDIRRAALMAENGKRLLVIEAAAFPGDGFREGLAWAELDEIRPLPLLPVDKRHNAKIDYPALREMLRR